MEKNSEILSNITIYNKYAKYNSILKRRESWEELVRRNMNMHIKRFPQLKEEIIRVYETHVLTKKVLPSMRSLQFAGKPIELNPVRIYNCCALPIDDYRAFNEVMFLLLSGTGVGYSVQQSHIDKLPEVVGPNNKSRRFVIGDSIEGWSDAVKILMKSYFFGKSKVQFDFSDIREKGTELITSGGKAPGPAPLEECLVKIKYILEDAIGRQLKDIEVHDILCHIADAVLAGGIRRAAMISLFNADSSDMLSCKSGNWWELNPQRGRANNSAVLLRHKLTEESFRDILKKTELSNAGEPGIYLTNDKDWLTNPCCEIALRPFQFCNLVEINASDIENQQDLNQRCNSAAFIATLQASYTNFHYLRPIWQRTTEKDALLGVSMTGIASGTLKNLDLEEAVEHIKDINSLISESIGINEAARTTCVKPAGTTSLVLGTSSGIHAWHNDYYIRRIRLLKEDALYKYLAKNHPNLIEDEIYRPQDTAVLQVPIKAPDGAALRTESPIDLLERIKYINEHWIKPGHLDGNNTHNVSATISIEKDQWELVVDWMWNNRDVYNGISLLPYDGGTYQQAPFEDITKEQYEEMSKLIDNINLLSVIEDVDNTDLSGEIACGAAGCEII